MDLADVITGEVSKGPWQSWRFTSIDSQAEKPDIKSITETAYVPPQVQIQDMMEAGLRLAAERKARFDSEILQIDEEKEEIPLDVTREPNVDLVDIQRAAAKVSVSMSAAEKVRVENARKEAERIRKEEIDKAVEAELARREKEKEVKP